MKQGKWKTILIALVLLGLFSTCMAPTAEQEDSRGTLPGAAVSERIETEPPVSEPIPVRAPVERTETPEPERTLAPVKDAPSPEPTPAPVEDTPSPEPTPTPTSAGQAYILNTNTYKFHKPSCSSVRQMNPSNKREYTGTRDQIISMGYSPCGRCDP